MKTNTLKLFFTKVITMALFFILAGPFMAQAADGDVVPSTMPAYCDPLPEDVNQLAECIDYWGTNGQIGIYKDINDPINGPGSGAYGMAGAYNPSNDTLLFVASTAYGTGIVGQMYQASTLTPQGQSFNIDQTAQFVGTPRAAYNEVTNNFFVVWQDTRPTGRFSHIYGRFVGPDGSLPSNDFAIYTASNSFLGDVVVDYTNQRYVVGFDRAPDGPRLVYVSFAGVVSEVLVLDGVPALYEGQSSITYNSNLDEYWYVYVKSMGGDDTPQEDLRVMWARVDARTTAKIGEPVQISATRVGRNHFSGPQIAYSKADGAAVVVWQEAGRSAGMVSEVYGRTIYDNFSLSPEHRILAGGGAYTTSDFYGAPDRLTYNSTTNSFAIAVQDNNNATTAVQFDSTGYVTEPREVIAQQSSLGNFNPTTIAAGNKFITPTSGGYSQTKIVAVPSSFSSAASGTANAGPQASVDQSINSEGFSKFISQLYIYALGLAALLAVTMSVFGGYLVMSARGNAQQATKGKDYLYSALIGLVLLMAAFILLNTLNPELTQFTLPGSFKLNQ